MDDVTVSDAAHDVPVEWFGDVYREQWPGMVRLAFVMVGDSSTAEDLVQEAFTRVFRRRVAVRDPLPCLRSAAAQWRRRAVGSVSSP